VSGVAAIILAAGAGERFAAAGGRTTKALAPFAGMPMVRRVAETAVASRARPIIVVTGSQADAVGASLDGLPVKLVHNAKFRDGLSTSLRAGVEALPAGVVGALVLLADMPAVDAALLDAMIARAEKASSALAVVPERDGRRGNPALLKRALFGAVGQLTGDEGAGRLLRAASPGDVVTIEAQTDAIFEDADTPSDLERIERSRGS
jgi:molybdenum cofactor cytidylyltransferase